MKSIAQPVNARVEERDMRRWGREDGESMINGQKAPIRRPRVRGTEGERKELFGAMSRCNTMFGIGITRGLTTRGRARRCRNEKAASASRSRVSERFVKASAQKVDALLNRDESAILCADAG